MALIYTVLSLACKTVYLTIYPSPVLSSDNGAYTSSMWVHGALDTSPCRRTEQDRMRGVTQVH